MINNKKAAGTALFMMAATLLAKFLGLYREVLFAEIYGMDFQAQAYLAASRIPLMFFDIALGTAVSSTFIPVFNEFLEKKDKQYALDFANRFVNLILIITGIMCAIGIIFAHPIVGMIAGGYSSDTKELTAYLIKILFPTMIFSGAAYAFVGLLQSFGRFYIPALISLVSNAIVVVYLFVFRNSFGVEGLAVAMLIGWSMQAVIQFPSLYKTGYRYKPTLSFRCEGIRKVVMLALPILISSWVQPINSLVNMSLSTYLNEGMGANALDYANKLYIILAGVITYAISNLIFPSMSALSASGDKEEYAKVIRSAVRIVVFMIVPVMTGFLILKTPIIRLVYERGEFNSYATELTSTALFYYSLGMLGFAATEIMNKGFYAMQDGKTPMVISMIGIAINVGLSFLLVRGLNLGVAGLAAAASVAANIIAVGMLCMLNKRVKGIVNKELGIHFLKTVISSLVMAACVVLTLSAVSGRGEGGMYKLVEVGVPVVVGVAVFIAMSYTLKIEEIKTAFSMLKKSR